MRQLDPLIATSVTPSTTPRDPYIGIPSASLSESGYGFSISFHSIPRIIHIVCALFPRISSVTPSTTPRDPYIGIPSASLSESGYGFSISFHSIPRIMHTVCALFPRISSSFKYRFISNSTR